MICVRCNDECDIIVVDEDDFFGRKEQDVLSKCCERQVRWSVNGGIVCYDDWLEDCGEARFLAHE